jgi:4a-hydroxytetrahydrobiopterin dehydratase
MSMLLEQHCQRDAAILQQNEVQGLLDNIPDWQSAEDGKSISRAFRFSDYGQTMAFVNKVAVIAEQQDHHPDMLVSYNRCTVTYTTHSAGGLSRNDFICAAHINAIAE